MYLLDTNIISELRKVKPHGGVLTWLKTISNTDLYISAVSIGEIQAGIEITREQDALKAKNLSAWLNKLMDLYNILPMDAQAFRIWATLMHRESNTVNEDAMIASTALRSSKRGLLLINLAADIDCSPIKSRLSIVTPSS